MNIEKMKNSNSYIYQHVDRTYNAEHEYHGRSYIDPDRSDLNFNISKNNRHHKEQKEYIQSQVHKTIKKNAVLSFSCITTLPRNYKEKAKTDPTLIPNFFQDIYEITLDYFHLTEDDVASAWVHMDEQSPHMHLLLTPLYRYKENDEEKTVLYFDKVVPRQAYQGFHQFVETKMHERGWIDLDLQNGNKTSIPMDQLKQETLIRELALKDEAIQQKDALILEKTKELEDKIKEIDVVNHKLSHLEQNLSKVEVSIQKKTKQESIMYRLFKRERNLILSFLKANISKLKKESQKDLKLLLEEDMTYDTEITNPRNRNEKQLFRS